MAQEKPTLAVSGSELTVLKVFWRNARLKVSEVHGILNDHGKAWAYNTVQTLIKRLEKKGYLRSEKQGRAFCFSSLVSQKEYISLRLELLAENICSGSRTPMMHALVENHQFSRAEIDDFKLLLEQLEKDFDSEKKSEGEAGDYASLDG